MWLVHRPQRSMARYTIRATVNRRSCDKVTYRYPSSCSPAIANTHCAFPRRALGRRRVALSAGTFRQYRMPHQHPAVVDLMLVSSIKLPVLARQARPHPVQAPAIMALAHPINRAIKKRLINRTPVPRRSIDPILINPRPVRAITHHSQSRSSKSVPACVRRQSR